MNYNYRPLSAYGYAQKALLKQKENEYKPCELRKEKSSLLVSSISNVLQVNMTEDIKVFLSFISAFSLYFFCFIHLSTTHNVFDVGIYFAAC